MNTLKEQDGKYYHECKVVMLATDEKEPKVGMISTRSDNNQLSIVDNSLVSMYNLHKEFGDFEPAIPYKHLYFLSGDEIRKGDWIITKYWDGYTDIEQVKDGTISWLNERMISFEKIIATTDESLKIPALEGQECGAFKSDDYQYSNECGWCGSDWSKCLIKLPKPSDSFIQKYIEEYNAGRQITNVLVEYDKLQAHDSQGNKLIEYDLKVNSDNTITIKKVKDSYSREEVIELLHKAWIKAGLNYSNPLKESGYSTFIKENL